MTCERFEELISARLDEPLGPDDEHLLEEHLAICEACRKFMEALTVHRELMRGLPSVAMVTPNAKPTVTDVPRRRFWEYRLTIPLPVAALLALVMGIGWWLALKQSSGDSLPSPASERLARSVEVVRVQQAVAMPVLPDKTDSLIQKGERSL